MVGIFKESCLSNEVKKKVEFWNGCCFLINFYPEERGVSSEIRQLFRIVLFFEMTIWILMYANMV